MDGDVAEELGTMSYDMFRCCPACATLWPMAETIRSELRESSRDRVPAVGRGEAIIYTRYGKEKSVAMHPADFHRLVDLDRDLAEIVHGGVEMSDLAAEAHLDESTPGAAIEDPAEIESILGL